MPAVQRAAHDRGNHPAGSGSAGSHRAHRRRRWVAGRDAGYPVATGKGTVVQARAAVFKWREGCGAQTRLPGSDRRSRRHSGRGSRVLARGVPGADFADLRGAGGRRLWLAVSRPPPGVSLHALCRQPVPDARDQRAVQHDADRHGDLLQGHAHGGAALLHARIERIWHRAGADGKDLQAALSRVRSSDHLRRTQLRRGEEDYLARRVRRVLGAAQSTGSPSESSSAAVRFRPALTVGDSLRRSRPWWSTPPQTRRSRR